MSVAAGRTLFWLFLILLLLAGADARLPRPLRWVVCPSVACVSPDEVRVVHF